VVLIGFLVLNFQEANSAILGNFTIQKISNKYLKYIQENMINRK